MVAATAITPAQNALATPSAPSQQTSSSGIDFSFHDILNIINPLQHLPVISTIYRALTGDTIKPFEKVAGDTLYGGVVGFASAMADTVFQAVTGKDFGDTVLGFLTGDDDAKPTGVASAAPASTSAQATQTASVIPFANPQVNVAPDSSIAAPQLAQLSRFTSTSDTAAATAPPTNIIPDSGAPDMSALLQSLNRSGVDPETARRAAFAYRRAVGLTPQPAPAAAAQPLS